MEVGATGEIYNMSSKIEKAFLPENEKPQTILSRVSLGMEVKEPKFRKSHYKNVRKLKRPFGNRRDWEEVVKPTCSWYPSKSTRFIFHQEWECEGEDVLRLCRAILNPSIWSTPKLEYVLVVPRYYGKKVHDDLYRKGFWLDKICNRWRLRRRYRHYKGHPNALSFIRTRTKKFSKKIQTKWAAAFREKWKTKRPKGLSLTLRSSADTTASL